MRTFERRYSFSTTGNGAVVDITEEARSALMESGIASGQLTVFVPGSTGAVTTVEYEPGLLNDLPELFEKLVPSNIQYKHDATWGDGNGFSHLRAALVGPSITIPISSGELVLGTWQQVVFLEFDNRARNREIVISAVGE